MLKQLSKLLKKEKPLHCAAVIVAAGSSSRMQGTDKIMTPLEGLPLIGHTIGVFQRSAAIQEIVVVTREELLSELSRLCSAQGFDKVKMITLGGASRVESVMRGLDHVSPQTRLAAVHDGARPLVTEEIIGKTVEKAQQYGAAAPAIPVKDTIKIAKNRMVTDTPERKTLFAIQTPQVIDFDLLRGALQQALDKNLPITDDCSAVEAMGMSVYLTDGSDENIKVTTPTDLVLAEAILRSRRQV